jgi:hypothetical protein
MKVPPSQCIKAGLGGVPDCLVPGSHVFHEAPGEQGMCGMLNSVHVCECGLTDPFALMSTHVPLNHDLFRFPLITGVLCG